MDGPAKITQSPVPPGGSYTYEFTVDQPETYFYHTHASAERQQAFGLERCSSPRMTRTMKYTPIWIT